MKRISTAEQCRALDARVISGLGIPGAALMELASRGVARAVARRFGDAARRGVVVVCGGGNNGGDGFAAARWLRGWGYPVSVWPLTPGSSGDAALQREAASRAGVPLVAGLGDAGVIVDAVFGTGLARPLEGAALAAIQAMNAHPAPIVAVDLPSGVHADTGAILGAAPRCAHTVTFGRYKPAFFAGPAVELVGSHELVDIGVEAAPGEDRLLAAGLTELTDLIGAVPARSVTAHKRNSGSLLVIAGSAAMAGAAMLTCRGALAAGAGLVTLVAPRGAWARLGALPPEVMVISGGEGDLSTALPPLDGFAAVVAGPGLGGGAPVLPALSDALRALWASFPGGALFDADALPAAVGPGAGPRIVTPHAGEAARLLGTTASAIDADRFGAAAALATDARVALLKGRYTLVAQSGVPTAVNPTGNPVLASGGTGDVLAGVAGALLARGATARDAARVAAFVHGAAADTLAAVRATGWTATDVAAGIALALSAIPTG